MGTVHGKRMVSKGAGTTGRPAGMQAINPALYQQIQQAVRELSQPRPPAILN